MSGFEECYSAIIVKLSTLYANIDRPPVISHSTIEGVASDRISNEIENLLEKNVENLQNG